MKQFDCVKNKLKRRKQFREMIDYYAVGDIIYIICITY